MNRIKSFFRGISASDIAVCAAIAAALPLLALLLKESGLDALSSALMLCCLYFAAKGKVISFIFGAAYGIAFGFVCFSRGLYALSLTNWFCTVPMQLICMASWLRHRGETTVTARRLSAKGRAFTLGAVALLCAGIASVLYFVLDSKYAVADAAVTVLQACSLLLLILRYMESWWISAVAYFASVLLWAVSLYRGASSYILLITTVVSFLLAVKGVADWYKMTRRESPDAPGKG